MRLRLLDLDGSLLAQPALARRAEAAQVIDLRDLEQALRLWATGAALSEFRRRLDRAGPPPGTGTEVTFIGSGDFHHLAAVLIARAPEPVAVLHFDNHPDWVRLPPAWHCGSWVNRVLDLPNVSRVITLGPCSDDLSWPELKGGNLAALASGRLQLWPWQHAPSLRLGRGPIVWNNLADMPDWTDALREILDGLPPGATWLTIDKDVLRPEDAATNWDQGQMPLSGLLQAIRVIARRRRIIGIDICGDYSQAIFRSPLKRLAAWFDRPAPDPAPQLWRNAAANSRLLENFAELAL